MSSDTNKSISTVKRFNWKVFPSMDGRSGIQKHRILFNDPPEYKQLFAGIQGF
jgi:hypothetical protein